MTIDDKTLPPIARGLDELNESATMAMAQRVRQLRAQGANLVSLTIGEPDFATPAHIAEAAIAAIRAGHTKYPPVPGIPELRSAVCQWLATQQHIHYSPDQIVVSTGAKQSIYNALAAILNPGDEVIFPAPYWVSYPGMTILNGGVPRPIHPADRISLKITPAELEAAITPRTRALLFNSPSNPSGAIYTRQELEALGEVLARHPGIWIISDEIYAMLAYDEPFFPFAGVESVAHRVITITGASKAFAMTGWRVGVMAAPAPIVRQCIKYQGQVTSGVCTIAQYAALAAFAGPMDEMYKMVEAFRARRDAGYRVLTETLPQVRLGIPGGAFYLLPDMSHWLGRTAPDGKPIATDDDLAWYLLDNGVATVAGSGFGAPGCIRLSYACPEATLAEGVGRMKAALDRLV